MSGACLYIQIRGHRTSRSLISILTAVILCSNQHCQFVAGSKLWPALATYVHVQHTQSDLCVRPLEDFKYIDSIKQVKWEKVGFKVVWRLFHFVKPLKMFYVSSFLFHHGLLYFFNIFNIFLSIFKVILHSHIHHNFIPHAVIGFQCSWPFVEFPQIRLFRTSA